MRDVTLVILNSLRIKCRIRRPLRVFVQDTCPSFHGIALWGVVLCEGCRVV